MGFNRNETAEGGKFFARMRARRHQWFGRDDQTFFLRMPDDR
jgi:hypothetical protein